MSERPGPCQHLEMQWKITATTSVIAIETHVWGVECLGCGRRWDVGQVMQTLVDKEAAERELEDATDILRDMLAECRSCGGDGVHVLDGRRAPCYACEDARLFLGFTFENGDWDAAPRRKGGASDP